MSRRDWTVVVGCEFDAAGMVRGFGARGVRDAVLPKSALWSWLKSWRTRQLLEYNVLDLAPARHQPHRRYQEIAANQRRVQDLVLAELGSQVLHRRADARTAFNFQQIGRSSGRDA